MGGTSHRMQLFANYIGKIGPNIPGLREELAEEIKFYKLPSEIAPLLVVTGFKKMEIMGPWAQAHGLWNGPGHGQAMGSAMSQAMG